MKKILDILRTVLVWTLIAASVGMMVFTIFSVNTFDRGNRSVFGYKFFIVRSDSMSETDFEAGDIIFVRETEPKSLKEGDIIAYTGSDNYGETITHKIRRLTVDENGEPGFVTYGTTTGIDDEHIVTYPYVLGKYVGRIPKAGTFFSFLKTTPGYIICILVPFLMLIGYNGLNCIILFRQYKREQMQELQAEKEQLAEERRQSAVMLEQLQSLRMQLEEKEAVYNEETPKE